MGFVRIKGIEGLLFVPEEDGRPKKYPCTDCYFCQMCSDTKCSLCLRGESCNKTQSETDILPKR